jgi:hypothetical protein
VTAASGATVMARRDDGAVRLIVLPEQGHAHLEVDELEPVRAGCVRAELRGVLEPVALGLGLHGLGAAGV